MITIDPGACTGWALFTSTGRLLVCGVHGDGEAVAWAEHITPGMRVLIERPDATRGAKQKASPEDLAKLFMRVGAYLERAEACGGEVTLVRPHAWKGTLAKEIHQPRIIAVLSLEERCLIPKLPKTKKHNVIDAIGLGLWQVGRLAR